MRIKEWKYREIIDTVTKYGDMWMDLTVERDDDEIKAVKITDGYAKFTCKVEVLKETEKAMQIRLADTFTTWVPKSAIAE